VEPQRPSVFFKVSVSVCRQNSGNIRELQNLIERAVILSNHGVLSNPLPAAGTQTAAIPPASTTLRDSERAVILQTLDAAGWAVGGPNGAAAKLGLKRTTLIYKMQKLAIFRPGLQSSLDLTGSAPQEPTSLPQSQ
jgi:DNA-binding NtrC family response regulator